MTRKKYGDDFSTGEIFHTAGITLTESHIVNWAGLTMDFYPLHMDIEYAKQSQFGERLVHGPLIFALGVGLVSSSGIAEDAAIAWCGVDNMRMLAPVKIGDTISVEVEVLAIKETSNPLKALQTWQYRISNQDHKIVLIFDYEMLFHMRPKN